MAACRTMPIGVVRLASVKAFLYRLRLILAEVVVGAVTHNMQQAARVSDDTGFMYLGELLEFGATPQIFTRPTHPRTEDYITDKYG